MYHYNHTHWNKLCMTTQLHTVSIWNKLCMTAQLHTEPMWNKLCLTTQLHTVHNCTLNQYGTSYAWLHNSTLSTYKNSLGQAKTASVWQDQTMRTFPMSVVSSLNRSVRPFSNLLKLVSDERSLMESVSPLLPKIFRKTLASVPALRTSPVLTCTWYEVAGKKSYLFILPNRTPCRSKHIRWLRLQMWTERLQVQILIQTVTFYPST